MSSNRASMFTPVGRGAIATVVVAGPDATFLASQCFRSATNRELEKAKIGCVLFGRWVDNPLECEVSQGADPVSSEELVVCRTEHDRVEVHCHGGLTAAPRILRSLERLGCETVAWQDLQRAGERSLVTQARVAITQAPTLRTAAILLDQVNGALADEIELLVSLVIDDAARATERLETLRQIADLGLHLTNPWKVVIAGPPNVGKSSLINALMGFERAIVFDQPGTTRDVVTARTAFDGWPVQLSDTAGLRSTNDDIEALGITLARQEMQSADLVLDVRDIREPLDKHDVLLNSETSRQIQVRNKMDLIDEPPTVDGLVDVSAKTGIGLKSLIERISTTLVPTLPQPGQPLLFTHEQLTAIEDAASHVKERHPEKAATVLASLRDG